MQFSLDHEPLSDKRLDDKYFLQIKLQNEVSSPSKAAMMRGAHFVNVHGAQPPTVLDVFATSCRKNRRKSLEAFSPLPHAISAFGR